MRLYGIGRSRARGRGRRAYQRVGPASNAGGRLGAREIVIARFVFGTRIVSMLFWGIHGLPFARFAVLDVIGCAIWASVLAPLGFIFSGSAAALVGEVKRAERWLLIALISRGRHPRPPTLRATLAGSKREGCSGA